MPHNALRAATAVVFIAAFCAARPAASSPPGRTIEELRGPVHPAPGTSPLSPPADALRSVPATEPERSVAIARHALEAALRAAAADPAGIGRPPRLSRADLEAVLAFYEARGHRPLWSDIDGWIAAGRNLVDRLDRAEEDGLDRSDYAVPAADASPAALARADLAASLAAVAYARDARGARIDPARLAKSITPELDLPSADFVLRDLAASADPGLSLEAYNPRHRGYRILRERLAEIRRDAATTETAALVTGSTARSAARTEPPSQQQSPISIAEIVANMERWRWMPRDLGERRIEVNIPEYILRVVEDGRVLHSARVVVGTPKTPTPIFSETMEYVVVNPSWSVPASILRKEFLPKLEADPEYAARNGYQVIRNGDRISIRQPPGERNALGFIKFMFPNEHAVYIHDTPQRKLFAREERAFSHGCVRVDQPFALADAVMAGTGFDAERLRGLIGKGEKTILLAKPLPVHIGYFTVVADDAGRLKRLPDIYGHDEKLRSALAQRGNRVAVR
jgi:murein L,D-transpeptidase YcbB/YkuD